MPARRREPERLEEFVFESTTMVLAAGLEMTKHSVTSAPGEFVREKGPLGIGSTWRCQVFSPRLRRTAGAVPARAARSSRATIVRHAFVPGTGRTHGRRDARRNVP